ncbi:helix-turn-helix domain-containing protein [Ruania suaedae]|uniref:helix-turn-helix domain-containing protein n=1 Tax=Ruania suaedae TaxID=2897774 RepID=UPI001E38C551|nr:helix-turn-helix domain-containing protein [Ruania suaedae]UFU02171.1 helix-turn-helix domain-containing protein [Ruania suaedae]
MDQRFLSLADVTEILQITMSQARALVRSGELRGIQIGGKGVWRVENAELEAYIERMYRQTAQRLRSGETTLD